jgi:hypothetical protein
MSAAIPDTLAFTVEALEAEGALCELDPGAGRAVALLPLESARRLEVPEDCRLAVHPGHDGGLGAANEVACGLGSPLLEKLVAEARALCPAASIRLDVDPPRPAHVRALVERFVLRNGLAEVGQMTMGTARYAVAYVAYAIEADDRREGLERVVTGADGSEPDAPVQARLDLTWPDPGVVLTGSVGAPGDAARWIALRGGPAVRAAAAPRIADVERRHGRDHERIAAYFAALIAEAQAPRRKTEKEAVEAKVAHLVAERDKKLRDLRERFAVKVRASLAAVAWAEVPAARVTVKLRRRKETREITLCVPAGAGTVDGLACEGCGAATGKPAACDERLHLLCEECAPSAQGRFSCPACAKKT